MSPFRSAASLLSATLFALPALAVPERDAFAADAISAVEAGASGLPFAPHSSYWPAAAAVRNPELPLFAIAGVDSRQLFRSLLLGRELQSERAGQSDLVGLLPLLRDERRAEISDLRGDLRDPGEVADLRPGPRLGMR